jgi:predicted ribosomally synthesized peptide with nif11-like leader
MIQNIKELLQNAQLQQQVKEATTLEEATKLITTAGTEKGYSFTRESVAQAIGELMLGEYELSEDEMLAVAGGLRCHGTCEAETNDRGTTGPLKNPTFLFIC